VAATRPLPRTARAGGWGGGSPRPQRPGRRHSASPESGLL